MADRAVLHCVVTSLLTGLIYGYTTGIVGGLSTPCVNKFFGVYTAHVHGDGTWECVANNFTESTESSRGGLYTSTRPTEALLASWRGLFSADILLGNLVGAYLGPACSKWYGRRRAMLVNAAIGTAASVGMAFAISLAGNVALRTLQGVAIGFCATVGPAYVSELAPPSRRGQLGTLFQVFICVAILVAQLTNYFFNPTNVAECLPDRAWQLQLAAAAVPCALLGAYAALWMPESPVFHAGANSNNNKSNNKSGSGHGSLNEHSAYGGALDESLLSPPHVASSSLAAAGVLGTIDENSTDFVEVGPGGAHDAGTTGWGALFSRRGFKWVLAAIGLPMCQQLTGINAIMFYGPTIISHMGFGSNALLVNFLAVGVWNLLSVFVSFALIDRLGRRVLMLGALGLMSVCLIALGVLFHTQELGSTALSYSSLALIMLFILAFETGPGPLFWVIANEMFPAPVRSESIAIANIFQSGFNIMLTLAFPVLLLALGDPRNAVEGVYLVGTGSTFVILGAIAVLSCLFVYARIPETRNMNRHALEPDQISGRKDGSLDMLNERRDLLGKTLLQKNLLETPAGVSWSPATAVGSTA
jgi:MFS family permease